MQLKRRSRVPRRIQASLAIATCSLLGSATGRSQVAEEPPRFELEGGLLYYGEKDRVSDASARIVFRKSFRAARSLKLEVAVDSLTGASPSGALASREAQTFTSPSGNDTYTTSAGETPLDPTFLDTRYALAATWEQPLGRFLVLDAGLTFSKEYDYLHTGLNARLERAFDERNTVLSVGFAWAQDAIQPVGGVPDPLSRMLPRGDLSNRGGDESKHVGDLVLGVTRVLGRRIVGQLDYSLSASSGYLTDPYKILSVIDPETGALAQDAGPYRFESRPGSRTKHALFAEVKQQVRRQDVFDAAYRFTTDDWGVQSHTLDLQYKLWFGERAFSLEPHLRYYHQTAADFFMAALVDGDPTPHHASADYRLGDLDATTVGVKLGWPLERMPDLSLRLEYYQQSGSSPPGLGSLPALRGLDLEPGMEAVIVQLGFEL